MSEEKLSMTAVGELLGLYTRFSAYEDDERFKPILRMLREADVTFAHFESTIPAPEDYTAGGIRQSVYCRTPAYMADELKWAGFDIISCAQDHVMDYGYSGIMSTIAQFDRVGLVHAGIGKDLGAAMAPAYFDTNKGRVALISANTGLPAWKTAMPCRIDYEGRPGIYNIRHYRTISKEKATKLKELRLPFIGFGPEYGIPEGTLQMEAGRELDEYRRVVIGDEEGYQWDESDLDQFLKQVSMASKLSSWCFVSFHCHDLHREQQQQQWLSIPSHVVELAHACIDAGADAYLGHGAHETRGIEVYKGKPIMYGIADFVDQHECTVNPAGVFEGNRLSPNATQADLIDVYGAETLRSGLAPASSGMSWERENYMWEGEVDRLQFNCTDKTLSQLQIYPIWKRKEKPVGVRGFPLMADPEHAKEFLEKKKRQSANLGTEITVENGVGLVTL